MNALPAAIAQKFITMWLLLLCFFFKFHVWSIRCSTVAPKKLQIHWCNRKSVGMSWAPRVLWCVAILQEQQKQKHTNAGCWRVRARKNKFWNSEGVWEHNGTVISLFFILVVVFIVVVIFLIFFFEILVWKAKAKHSGTKLPKRWLLCACGLYLYICFCCWHYQCATEYLYIYMHTYVPMYVFVFLLYFTGNPTPWLSES